jgi:hypothetical protein
MRSVMPGSPGVLPRSAVYYPYIHIRDGRWLKVAALYWPHIVRIVSPGYPTRNSSLVDVLTDELGFVINHTPDQEARALAGEFAQTISDLGPDELTRLRVPRDAALHDPSALVPPRPPVGMGDTMSSATRIAFPP